MRFVFIVAATTLSLAFSHTEIRSAEDAAFPSSLLGFIQPGMPLGVTSNQRDSLIRIEIFGDEQFRLAKDARKMTMEELGKKYPHVAEKAATALAEFASSERAQMMRPQTVDPASPGEPAIELRVDRDVMLCTVLHVGEDYLLVTYGADNTLKQVIAKQSIARIRWTSDDLRFRFYWATERPK